MVVFNSFFDLRPLNGNWIPPQKLALHSIPAHVVTVPSSCYHIIGYLSSNSFRHCEHRCKQGALDQSIEDQNQWARRDAVALVGLRAGIRKCTVLVNWCSARNAEKQWLTFICPSVYSLVYFLLHGCLHKIKYLPTYGSQPVHFLIWFFRKRPGRW